MDDEVGAIYDYDSVEVEAPNVVQTSVTEPKESPTPFSEEKSKAIDEALDLLPDSTTDLDKMSPAELKELKDSFIKTVNQEITGPEPKSTPEKQPPAEGNQLSKDVKVELTAAAIVEQGELITTINSLGEGTTYMAEKTKIGETPIVAYWKQGSDFELECYCLSCMRKPVIMKTARCRVPGTSSNIKSICSTSIHQSALLGKRLSQSDRHSILVSAHLTDSKGNDLEPIYYDMEKGEIMEYSALPTEKQGRCFRRFCNSTDGIAHVPYIPEEALDIELIKEHFELARTEMKTYYSELAHLGASEHYGVRFEDSVMKWACDSLGLYVDILTLAAVPLLVRKPECTFFILGEKGNGKSSFRHLLQCVYGTRNVSGVQVSQMGSWDYASTLLGKTLNFPDEESTNIESMDKAVFKSMSTHESITIRQKGSSIPFEILCDFPSIIPLNELPNWRNLDGGVARRITILPFNANLMAETKQGGIGYEERTYTPEFISRFLGEIMGIASFYTQTGNPIVWSAETMKASNAWANEMSSIELFVQDFRRVFHGFVSVKLLYQCYQNWCRGGLGAVDTGIEYQYETLKRLKEVMCVFGGWDALSTTRLPDQTVPIKYTRHKGTKIVKPEYLLWEGALVDVGAAEGGAAWANGRDNVITVAQCLEYGWDPVTLRLMSQGLRRRDMENGDSMEEAIEKGKQRQLEKTQANLMDANSNWGKLKER